MFGPLAIISPIPLSFGLSIFISTSGIGSPVEPAIQKNLVEYQVSTFVCVPLLIESIYKKIWQEIEKTGQTKKVKFGMKLSKFLLKFGIDIRAKLFKQNQPSFKTLFVSSSFS